MLPVRSPAVARQGAGELDPVHLRTGPGGAGRGRGMGHVLVTCNRCHDQYRQTAFYEPPHDRGHRPFTGWVTAPDPQSLARRRRRPGQRQPPTAGRARPRRPRNDLLGRVRADDAGVPARCCRAGGGREPCRVRGMAVILSDPDGDGIPAGGSSMPRTVSAVATLSGVYLVSSPRAADRHKGIVRSARRRAPLLGGLAYLRTDGPAAAVAIERRTCPCCRGERADPGRDPDCRQAARGSTTAPDGRGWHRASRGPVAVRAAMSSLPSTSVWMAGTSAAAGSAWSWWPRRSSGSCHAARRSPGRVITAQIAPRDRRGSR